MRRPILPVFLPSGCLFLLPELSRVLKISSYSSTSLTLIEVDGKRPRQVSILIEPSSVEKQEGQTPAQRDPVETAEMLLGALNHSGFYVLLQKEFSETHSDR